MAGVLEGRAMRPAVPIPTTVGQGDDANAGFDEAAGSEEVIVEQRSGVAVAGGFGRAAAVTVAQARIFAVEVERFRNPARGEDVEGLLRVAVGALHDLRT